MHSGVLHGLARTWLQWSAPAACHPSLTQCHPERSEGSRYPSREILRCAQDDTGRPIRLSWPGEPMVHYVGINASTLAPTESWIGGPGLYLLVALGLGRISSNMIFKRIASGCAARIEGQLAED